MTTIREKYLEKIKEDFEVLSTIVLQQMELVITATHDNKDGELYTKIEHNEVIIDGLEVKIRDEVINSIVLYCPRASDCRKIMSYHDMNASVTCCSILPTSSGKLNYRVPFTHLSTRPFYYNWKQ